MAEFEELRIRARPIGGGRHLVVAGGAASGAAVIRAGDAPARLRQEFNDLVDIKLHLAPRRDVNIAERLRALGREVFGVLFGTGLDRQLHKVLTETRSLRLRFELPPGLTELPVETLCTPNDWPGQSLALDSNRSVVRTLTGMAPTQRLPSADDVPQKVNILIAVASPKDLPAIDAEAEIAAARARWNRLTTQSNVVRGATREAIQKWAKRQTGPAAVLLIAHGDWDSERGEGVVFLQTEDGSVDPVGSDLLSGILVKAEDLRLVMLSLCHSADSRGPETFAGLAHAIIGKGVPAVIGMSGRVSDTSARKIGPVLVERVCSNETLDEAVSAARQLVPDSIEWATMNLFCHERFGHSRLFKVRGVHKNAGGAIDPWRGGQEALDELSSPEGDIAVETMVRAAKYLRERRDWKHILQNVLAEHDDRELQRLIEEAELELAWPELRGLCEVLAADGDPLDARERLREIADRLPEVVTGLLVGECAHLSSLDSLAAEAKRAEADADWGRAAGFYRQVLEATDGADFRGAEALLRTAEEEAELAEQYAAALAHRRARRWKQAREVYRQISAKREGYQDIAQCSSYVDGRIAEAAEDWEAAAAAFEACGEYQSAPLRAAHAKGRAAAGAGDWEQAGLCFAEAWPKAESWRLYSLARYSEECEDWTGAAEYLDELDGFEDAAQRRVLISGHLAAESEDWREAVACFAQVPELEPPLEQARGELYSRAIAAEESGEWAWAAADLAALPSDYLEVDERLPYCTAREAEDSADWAKAEERYRSTGHRDAPDRRRYAEGRLSEANGEWAKAGERYATLPERLLDVRDRLRYAHGRTADADSNWRSAIIGFGELPDSFDSGEVGRRRRFARASLAAADGEWESVIALLRLSPDEERDHQVGLLRGRAHGALCEEAGDWAGAAEVYALARQTVRAVPDLPLDPAAEHRYWYALLRRQSAEADWDAVLITVVELPEGHRDADLHRRYAAATLVVRDGMWAEAVELCRELPDDFRDTAALRSYARMRLADVEADWSLVVALCEEAEGYSPLASAFGAYAEGRLAEADEDWAKAAKEFRSCPGHADADARACRADARQLEQAGHWTAAIAAYEAALATAANVLGEDAARLDHLRNLCSEFPWAEGIASATLAADPIALEQSSFPYFALRDAGITPASSATDVGKAAFELMQRGGWGDQARLAWDRLRYTEQRLLLDAQLYWLREADRLTVVLSDMAFDDSSDPLAALCQQLPKDAPLFALLSGSRAEAIAAWRSRLVADPADMRTAHCLAVACYWLAQRLEETGAWEQAEATWRTALACWAAVINDDGFWVGWRQSRAACFGHAVTPADSNRVRARLGQHLVDVLARTAERHASDGHPGPAARNRALIELFESEMEATRCLKEAGGLPLDGEDRTVACGAGYLEIAELRETFARFIARSESEPAPADFGSTSPVDGALLRRLRWLFSELSVAFMAFEHHRFEASLAALPEYYRGPRSEMPSDCGGADADGHSEDCERCRDFLARNPAYARLPQRQERLRHDAVDLAVRVRMSIAHGLLSAPGRLDEAIEELRKAIEAAGAATMTVRTRQAALWMILGRADSLAETTVNTLRRLDEAIELLQRARDTVGPIGKQQIDRKLADLLVDRAVLRRAADLRADITKSLEDLRTAFGLHSESIRIIETLARALLTAVDRSDDHETAKKWRHLREALELLDHGLRLVPGSALLEAAIRDVLSETKSLNLTSLSVERLAELVEHYDEAEESARLLAHKGSRHLAAGDLVEAIDDLVRAVAAEPSNAEYRAALLEALRRMLDPDAGQAETDEDESPDDEEDGR